MCKWNRGCRPKSGLDIGRVLPKTLRESLSDTVILAIVPEGRDCFEEREALRSQFWANGHTLVCHQDAGAEDGESWSQIAFLPRQVTPFFDADMSRCWLDYRQSKHSQGNCQSTPANLIRGLKLIDCSKRTVVAAPAGAPYVTLSYVWGSVTARQSVVDSPEFTHSQQQQNPRSSNALIGLPSVVSDAIQVTRMLGYNYLWVDRYCIDQGNPREVLSQVSKMDLMYSGSESTIVAAAGHNETFGIPGVPGTTSNNSRQRQSYLRQHQMIVSIRDSDSKLAMLSSLPHPHHTIKQSK